MTVKGVPNETARTVQIDPGTEQGRLIVLYEVPVIKPDGSTARGLRCLCSPVRGGCGNTITVLLASFVHQHVRSCGCLHKESVKAQIEFRNKVLAGIPAAQRKEYWASVRCSLAKEPERAARLLEEAEQRQRRTPPITEEARQALNLRKRQERAEARKADGLLTPGRMARWDRTARLDEAS